MERSGRHIRNRKLQIDFDNREQCQNAVERIRKSNACEQEARAEVTMIKRILSKIKFEIEIKLIRGCNK